MKEKLNYFVKHLQNLTGNRMEVYLTVGLLAFHFLGVGFKNNPLFSFTYNQGLLIAFYIFASLFIMASYLKVSKRFLSYLLVWVLYGVVINLFLNKNSVDIAFIFKMPILFLLYMIFKQVHLPKKAFFSIVTIIFISFFLYGLKMLQVVVLNYNLTANKENSSVIGMSVAYGLILCIPILRYIIKPPKKIIQILIPTLYLAGILTVFLLGARTTVLIILFTAFLDYGIPMSLKKKKSTFYLLAITIYVIGILFPIIYGQLVRSSDFFSRHDFLTGREIIWDHLLDSLKGNMKLFLFGYGLDRQYGRWPHEHNGFLAIIMRYGVVGLSLFTAFWWLEIRKFFKQKVMAKFQIELLYFILPILLMAYTEPVIAIADYFVPIYFTIALALTPVYHQNESLEWI